MLILEGVSDADLWHVGQVLRGEFGYSLRRHQPGPTGWIELTARVADSQPSVCYLRSHISDAVGMRLEGKELGAEEVWGFRTLELALLSRGAVAVVVRPDREARAETVPLPWSGFGTRRVETAYGEGWERLPWRTRLPVISWPVGSLVKNGKATRRLVSFVASQQREEAKIERLLPPSLGIGSVRPRFLVIGEGPAPSCCPLTACGDLPDLPFSRGPASELLWRAVDELDLRWEEGYWCNAATFLAGSRWGWANVPPVAEKILCLGEAAEHLVQSWYGPHHAHLLAAAGRWKCVSHPSAVRRFAAHEYTRWRDEIGFFLGESCAGSDALERRSDGLNLTLDLGEEG